MDKLDKKFSIKKKILISVAALLVFIVGVIIPVSMPSGLERLDGVKRHAAEYMIGEVWQRGSGINVGSVAGTFQITVDNVSEDNSENTQCNGEFTDTSLEGADNYFVTLTHRTFFGIPLSTTTYHVCRAR